MKNLIIISLFSICAVTLISCEGSGVIVDTQPATPYYERPVSPGSDYIWIEGDWVVEGGHYTWHNGYWSRPHGGRSWEGGSWESKNNGWRWRRGHWR